MIGSIFITVVMPQTECQDLLLDLFKCSLMITAHADVFLGLLIFLSWHMNSAIIMVCKATGYESCISLVGLNLFLSLRLQHCRRCKNDTLDTMRG